MKKQFFLNVDKNDEVYILKDNKYICQIDYNNVDLRVREIEGIPFNTKIEHIDINNLEKDIKKILSQYEKKILSYEIQLVINYKN